MKKTCLLCQKKKKLQKRCHIISEFYYRELKLYHEYHNLVMYDFTTLINKGELKIVSKNRKMGFYENYIFCNACEKIFGNNETYVREILFNKNLGNSWKIDNSNPEFLEIYNYDFEKVKLHFLSILWRSFVADNNFFDKVNLDDNESERIRKALHANQSEGVENVSIFFMISLEDNIPNNMIAQPREVKFGGESGFLFVLGPIRFVFTFKIPNLPKDVLRYRLTKSSFKLATRMNNDFLIKMYEK